MEPEVVQKIGQYLEKSKELFKDADINELERLHYGYSHILRDINKKYGIQTQALPRNFDKLIEWASGYKKLLLWKFESFCRAVSFDDRGYRFAYSTSSPIKNQLINLGPSILPNLSVYLLSLKENEYRELIMGQNEPNKDDLEQCCVMLFCEIVRKNKINIDKHSPINGLNGWIEWGKNFNAEDPANYLI